MRAWLSATIITLSLLFGVCFIGGLIIFLDILLLGEKFWIGLVAILLVLFVLLVIDFKEGIEIEREKIKEIKEDNLFEFIYWELFNTKQQLVIKLQTNKEFPPEARKAIKRRIFNLVRAMEIISDLNAVNEAFKIPLRRRR